MPCLYFRLWSLPSGESPFDIDTVFRRLVPDAYKAGLHSYGGIGGISIDVSFVDPLSSSCFEKEKEVNEKGPHWCRLSTGG